MTSKFAIKLFMMLSVVLLAVTSCDDDETEYKTITLHQTTTKSSVSDADGSVGFQWQKSDYLYVYNITKFNASTYKLSADESSNSTTFSGKIDCDKKDQLIVIYPASSVSIENNVMVVSIGNQKGTLESIGDGAWVKIGKAKVTAASKRSKTATGQMYGPFVNELGLVKISFTNNGKPLNDVTRVSISKVHSTASIDPTENSGNVPPELYRANAYGVINCAEPEGNTVYVSMFPGDETPTFFVNAEGGFYEGTAKTFTVENNKVTEVTVDLAPVPSSSYIEVAGVKWAPANLIYENNSFKIADKEAFAYQSVDASNSDLFNWGVCGTLNANDSEEYLQIGEWKDIEGKFYSDVDGGTETYNSVDANYGDIAYRATNGKYRLPSYDEFYKIATVITESDHTIDGIKAEWTTIAGVNGYKITDESNGNSIFLPAAGYRERGGGKVGGGVLGKYFTARSTGSASAFTLRFDKDNFYLIGDPNSNEYTQAFKMLGGSIRPVLAE